MKPHTGSGEVRCAGTRWATHPRNVPMREAKTGAQAPVLLNGRRLVTTEPAKKMAPLPLSGSRIVTAKMSPGRR